MKSVGRPSEDLWTKPRTMFRSRVLKHEEVTCILSTIQKDSQNLLGCTSGLVENCKCGSEDSGRPSDVWGGCAQFSSPMWLEDSSGHIWKVQWGPPDLHWVKSVGPKPSTKEGWPVNAASLFKKKSDYQMLWASKKRWSKGVWSVGWRGFLVWSSSSFMCLIGVSVMCLIGSFRWWLCEGVCVCVCYGLALGHCVVLWRKERVQSPCLVFLFFNWMFTRAI